MEIVGACGVLVLFTASVIEPRIDIYSPKKKDRLFRSLLLKIYLIITYGGKSNSKLIRTKPPAFIAIFNAIKTPFTAKIF